MYNFETKIVYENEKGKFILTYDGNKMTTIDPNGEVFTRYDNCVDMDELYSTLRAFVNEFDADDEIKHTLTEAERALLEIYDVLGCTDIKVSEDIIFGNVGEAMAFATNRDYLPEGSFDFIDDYEELYDINELLNN